MLRPANHLIVSREDTVFAWPTLDPANKGGRYPQHREDLVLVPPSDSEWLDEIESWVGKRKWLKVESDTLPWTARKDRYDDRGRSPDPVQLTAPRQRPSADFWAGNVEPDQRADAGNDAAEGVQCSPAECETSDDCGFCKTICYENCACTWGCIDGYRYAYECDGLANCSCFEDGKLVATCKGKSASDSRSTCDADNCCGFPSPAL